jgi:hypothetical protein
MSYIFGDDGTLGGTYPDSDPRAFVLQGLNRSLTADEVATAITNQTPSQIAGFTVLQILNEPVLRDLAATVFSESSHVPDESEGIMRVMRNRAVLVNVSYGSPNFWSSHAGGGIGGDGIVGRSTSNYTNANSISIDQWTDPGMVTDRAGTVRGLVNSADITAGAYFWLATSALQNSGVIQDGLNANPPVFLVTATLGATTFIKYNPNNPDFGSHVWP